MTHAVLADRARAAGVDVLIDEFDEMQHVFQMGVGNVPESTEAVQRIATYLRPRLGLDRARHRSQSASISSS